MKQNSCQTNVAGDVIACAVAADGEGCGCAPASSSATSTPSMWHKTRPGIMMVVACLTSPCCTPLIVPLLLFLLAGSPVAVWLTAYVGWVYGVLTLVSVITFGLGWRWAK